ncbi:hypothetical protein G7Y89_g7297 [Cudoniella acicularis]|uniref:PHD and RING finger domain-containing protein n=1 Tax=Cudoniella acicularis TaxID=354080 RepID=A0A8H4W3Y9_9HELO|nr:hypothetical protein G7Y89_g7297 [Cudoniella acicularis]
MPPSMDDHSSFAEDDSDMVPDAMVHDLQVANGPGKVANPTTELPTTPNTENSTNDSSADGDQCIVCLDLLTDISNPIAQALGDAGERAHPNAQPPPPHPGQEEKQAQIALIKPCGHILHDECLRLWSQKANSCPICRQTFNLVEVLDKVDGTVQSEYAVEDKKQSASTEFDPNWIVAAVEEEESVPCPICGNAEREDVLLLCDGCNAPYHTFCIGLSGVPRGQWFCMECHNDGLGEAAHEEREMRPFENYRLGPRTQAMVRRDRVRERHNLWVGTWNDISNRVHDATGLDLDFSDDEGALTEFRRLHRRTSDETRAFRQWQQRLEIAGRQGARDIFRAAAPPNLPRTRRPRTPPTPAETVEETRAWGDFEKAKEMDTEPSRGRKRKSRSATNSATASPADRSEPREPERKLKRPRTRRVLPEASSSTMTQPIPQINGSRNSRSPPTRPVIDTAEPSFLSSLLKEVEMGVTSDDDSSRTAFSSTTVSGPNRVTSPSVEYSSPAASPSPSSSHTPRASSITPPPHIAKRHPSPCPLTSHVEPIYPRADYSPNRSPGETSDMTNRDPTRNEVRQPRPRRQKPTPLALSRSPDSSPVRATMSAQAKESINLIVKSALAPHWKSSEISKEQYADVNRDVSRKLYEMVADRDVSEEKEKWEKIAVNEVATAVQALTSEG